MRLRPALEGAEIEFICTQKSVASMVDGHHFYVIQDGNRWNKLQLVKAFLTMRRIINNAKPDVIITTGSAPGLMGVIAGRLKGVKTIWIDSIANVEHLSMSGRIARNVAHVAYTQWPHLANEKTLYKGNILS
jgi:UDP-N-acetylglucosamine:LPS N-acetylglucosamine transferase